MEEYSVGHVAIIPDGNRRWAEQKSLSPWLGHKAGVEAFEKILTKALALKIYCLSFWGMSLDNIAKRPVREVNYLLRIFSHVLKRALANADLEKHDVKISILGEWREKFPSSLVAAAKKAIEETKNRKTHILNLLLCYDGKAEMMRAFEKARQSKKDFTSPKEYLFTRDLPPVDLVIRTGGEAHLSTGFMMWDTADAQLSFSNKLWPDYTPEDFEAAIRDFVRRERRYGS